ncbi:MAG: hypothetical protein ACJ731_07685 [Vicinamibacterales bacterium]
MDVVHDLLDKHIVDRNGREMGRVDGILLEDRPNEPPRLVAVLIGASALGLRVNPLVGRWVHGVEVGLGIGEERPIRIDVSHVDEIGERVRVDLTAAESRAETVERRLRDWILRIPGSR